MDFRLSRARLGMAVLQDVVILGVLAYLVAASPLGTLTRPLALGIGAVLAWGLLTLHFPTRVRVTEDAIALCAYGRCHRFRWDALRAVHVRRFLVKDRILVRLVPAPPWRGRYWITDSLDPDGALAKELERRALLIRPRA